MDNIVTNNYANFTGDNLPSLLRRVAAWIDTNRVVLSDPDPLGDGNVATISDTLYVEDGKYKFTLFYKSIRGV